MKRKIMSGLITLLVGIILFYIFLPPLNIHSMAFYVYIFFLVGVYYFSYALNKVIVRDYRINFRQAGKSTMYLIITMASILGLIIVVNIINAPIFMAKAYATRITIDETAQFIDDIKPVDYKALPLLDKDSSQKLGDRVMGQMPELVSQFNVSNLYTQINYNQDIVRVTPLEYANAIKFFTNYKTGVKGYIMVNSVTGESTLVKLDKGMKYLPSALFFKNLNRYIRFKYPTMIFGEETFEVDNDGNPYWIVPTIKYAGIGLRPDVSGVIIVNAVTGESKHYRVSEVPTWVDHVYSAKLIIEQVNDWGLYRGGFFNSVFSQKNVVATTTGYNYTVMNDDVYLYTGITSIANDEANIGFILINMRTKETKFYAVPGAEEYSAMASAEGQVQQMGYTATFPLLINVNNRPTYLISLKDAAGLVKMYALVDVVDYQKVVVTDASKGIAEAIQNYGGKNTTNDLITKTITISSIKNVIIDNNTYYYIIDSNSQKYRVSIKVNPNLLPFIEPGNTIEISYADTDEVIDILKIK